MLLSILDDSDSGKVRKSIIIVAALLILVSNYDIQLNIPDLFLSSDKSKLLIEHEKILYSLFGIQIYLVLKLMPSWYVDYSLFKKEWIRGQYAVGNDLSEVKKEIETFISYCNDNQINQNLIQKQDIENLELLEKICKGLSEQLTKINVVKLEVNVSTDEIYKKYDSQIEVLREVYGYFADAPEKNLLSREINQKLQKSEAAARDIERTIALTEQGAKQQVKQYEKSIEGMNAQAQQLSKISRCYDKEVEDASNRFHQFKNNLKGLESFVEQFPDSTFHDAIGLSKNYLRTGRRIRQGEVIVFNLLVPLAIGGYSMIHVLCLN